MRARGLRVRDVAQGAEVNERAISDFLAARRHPSPETMHRFVRYFTGITGNRIGPHDLFDTHNAPVPAP